MVRPTGAAGSLGLVLPTLMGQEVPVQAGNTVGTTRRQPGGADGTLAGFCRWAERAGADAVWAVDHLYWPHPMIECLTALAVAATATQDLGIGSCVLQVPLRRSAAVAKQAASLQVLSAGRLVLGVGVGSHRGEYDAAGVDFSARGHLLDEAVAALRRDWSVEAGAEHPGASRYLQLPAPSPIPIWVGGSSPAARRRAARSGDGWVPLFMSPTDYRASLEQLLEEAEAAGRPPGAITPAVVVFVRVAQTSGRAATAEQRARDEGTRWLSELYGIPPRAFDPFLVAGTAERCLDQIEAYRAAGAAHVITMAAAERPIEHFAELLDAWRPGGSPARAEPRPDLVEVPA